MHEVGLAQEVVRIVEEAALGDGGGRVRAIRLEVGALAGIEVESLRFALEAMLPGTVAQGAGIEIESIPGRGECAACGGRGEVWERLDLCPGCGAPWEEICGGVEFLVRNLDLE